VNAGDTFIPAKPYDHLYAIISDPSLDPTVVIVNFTTWTPQEEQACIAMPGEHPFLTLKSAVRYKDARIATAGDLEKLLAKGKLTRHEPLSGQLLGKMRDGVVMSDFVPEKCRRILEDQVLI